MQIIYFNNICKSFFFCFSFFKIRCLKLSGIWVADISAFFVLKIVLQYIYNIAKIYTYNLCNIFIKNLLKSIDILIYIWYNNNSKKDKQ